MMQLNIIHGFWSSNEQVLSGTGTLLLQCYGRWLCSCHTRECRNEQRRSNTTDVTCGAGSAYPSGAPEITSGFGGVLVDVLCCALYTAVCLLVSEGLIYDQTIRKLVANQTLSVDGGPEFHQVSLLDYNTGMEYIVRDNKCTKMNITTTEPGCIPTNATVVKQSYIGAGANMVKTTIYRFVDGQMLVYLTVADDGCVPVIYESTGMNTKGESVKMGIQYMGIEAVASDASVFNMPASCSMS
ncbi:UBQLN [Mytilus coruscus]|uniref:UBQLN n=1 Tax=Mytilus coruscus TaxID=42192 RepID=A0A6J8F2E6_MYTCO|nr:UBQLN [Mytilus coruscus]